MSVAGLEAITVGVADLDAALRLWRDTFGLEIVSTAEGGNAHTARLLGCRGEDIAAWAVLRTPSQPLGRLHLVAFRSPGEAIRAGARVFDLCAKNLDVYARDLPRRMAELRADGFRFRNEDYSEVAAPNGMTFREIHLPAHDAVNVVLLEVLGADYPFTDRGFAAVGPLVTIVADAAAEKAFWRDVIGLDLMIDHVLDGPEVEAMVGLPPGAALEVAILGREGSPFGQVEVIAYRGTQGADRYVRATATATGIRAARLACDDPAGLAERLRRSGVAIQRVEEDGDVTGLFSTPAGFRLEAPLLRS